MCRFLLNLTINLWTSYLFEWMKNPSPHLSSYLSLHMRTTATIDTTRPISDTKIRTANRMNTGSMTSLLTLRVLLITSYLVLFHLKQIKSVPISLWFRPMYVTENKSPDVRVWTHRASAAASSVRVIQCWSMLTLTWRLGIDPPHSQAWQCIPMETASQALPLTLVVF